MGVALLSVTLTNSNAWSETFGKNAKKLRPSPVAPVEDLQVGEALSFNESTPDDSQTPACRDVLSRQGLQSAVNNKDLYQCYNELSKAYRDPGLSLQEAKRRALSMPSVREKAFVGFVLGCYGETYTDQNSCDRMVVMLTMQNRARLCNQTDPKEAKDQYNALDVALQQNQFSAFRPDKYFARADRPFELTPDSAGDMGKRMRGCIDAFNDFAHHRMSDFETSDKQVKANLGPEPTRTNLPSAIENSRTPSKHQASQIVHYFAKFLADQRKEPWWTEYGTTTGLSCQTRQGRETASTRHLAFADHWECGTFLKDQPQAEQPKAQQADAPAAKPHRKYTYRHVARNHRRGRNGHHRKRRYRHASADSALHSLVNATKAVHA